MQKQAYDSECLGYEEPAGRFCQDSRSGTPGQDAVVGIVSAVQLVGRSCIGHTEKCQV